MHGVWRTGIRDRNRAQARDPRRSRANRELGHHIMLTYVLWPALAGPHPAQAAPAPYLYRVPVYVYRTGTRELDRVSMKCNCNHVILLLRHIMSQQKKKDNYCQVGSWKEWKISFITAGQDSSVLCTKDKREKGLF